MNARTVLKVSSLDARAAEEEVEEEEPVLCLKIPDEVEVVFEIEQKEIRKEETTFNKKGVKRKRTQHECDVCEKRFRHSNGLKYHKRIHANEKPYKCVVCEKRFRTSSHLKVRERIHTNEKPFECDVCEKRYRQSNGLKYHMRTQH